MPLERRTIRNPRPPVARIRERDPKRPLSEHLERQGQHPPPHLPPTAFRHPPRSPTQPVFDGLLGHRQFPLPQIRLRLLRLQGGDVILLRPPLQVLLVLVRVLLTSTDHNPLARLLPSVQLIQNIPRQTRTRDTPKPCLYPQLVTEPHVPRRVLHVVMISHRNPDPPRTHAPSPTTFSTAPETPTPRITPTSKTTDQGTARLPSGAPQAAPSRRDPFRDSIPGHGKLEDHGYATDQQASATCRF